MISFVDLLVVGGLFLLRVGVPAAVIAGLAYLLKRLDRRWEEEARAEQRARQALHLGGQALRPDQQPEKPQPAGRPVTTIRVPEVKIPFVPPPPSPSPFTLPQPGLVMAAPAGHCWDVRGCSESARSKCPASQHPELSCWQARLDAEGHIPDDCVSCDIFQRYPLM